MFEETFLLNTKTAQRLYNSYAKTAPIYDYHCHLSAKEIYEDKSFDDISTLWLQHDHYKWRAMRYAGVDEEIVTGNADGLTKFKTWAKTCARLIGCPLYHWTNMELNEYFGVTEVLKESNAEKLYRLCNNKLKEDSISPVKMIQKANVKLICTTDDPTDKLEYHRLLKGKTGLTFKVLPTFRPDKALNIRKEDFTDYISLLSEQSGKIIKSYQDLISALIQRIEYFRESGCILSDHSLESLSYTGASLEEVTSLQKETSLQKVTSLQEVEKIFADRISGKTVSMEEAEQFRMHTLILLAAEYRRAGWVMQLHIGALRNTNEELFNKVGADSGFDLMNDFRIIEPLVKLFNTMNQNNGLPKTILYTLNSKDNLVLSSLPHSFCGDNIAGKLQFGPAWWFNDHKEGMLNHLTSIANQGMLADFVGMLTDSRSFLSYVRHDYFRRILCSFVGGLVESGEFDHDVDLLRDIIEGICYKNIIKYLGVEEV